MTRVTSRTLVSKPPPLSMVIRTGRLKSFVVKRKPCQFNLIVSSGIMSP